MDLIVAGYSAGQWMFKLYSTVPTEGEFGISVFAESTHWMVQLFIT